MRSNDRPTANTIRRRVAREATPVANRKRPARPSDDEAITPDAPRSGEGGDLHGSVDSVAEKKHRYEHDSNTIFKIPENIEMTKSTAALIR